jgi:hypothetical protein
MKDAATRSTTARPLPPTAVHSGDAYCRNDSPDASPDFDVFSQLTETDQLKTPRLITSHSPTTCVTRLRPPAPTRQPKIVLSSEHCGFHSERGNLMKRFLGILGAALFLSAAEPPVAPLGACTPAERRHWG